MILRFRFGPGGCYSARKKGRVEPLLLGVVAPIARKGLQTLIEVLNDEQPARLHLARDHERSCTEIERAGSPSSRVDSPTP